MKQFIKNQKVTYNLMSFTGFKALIIFSLLAEGPKSYEEISEYILNHPYLREKISIDTLRVYINSLKRLGCEIKRFRGEDKISRYMIVTHPFELTLSNEEKQSVLKVYRNIVKNMDIQELLAMDSFFEKLGRYLKDNEFISTLKKYSPLKEINPKLTRDLLDYCNRKDQIIITYNSPNSGEKHIEIIVDKIDVSNGKLYLYGTGLEYNQYGSFLLSRIKSVDSIKLEKTIPNALNEIHIKYELTTDNSELKLDENEKLLEQTDKKVIIELTTSNEFLAKQKLLEFGPKCKIIEPESFRNDFINLLKNMKTRYYCGK